MKLASVYAIALFASAMSAGCSSAGDSSGSLDIFPAIPLTTLSTDSGRFRVEVRTAPDQPPARGEISVELLMRDTSGAPVDGLAVSVVPWMPAMGHGTSIEPVVTPKGEGKYLVTQVSLFMPGEWQLRTSIGGQVSDHVAPSFSIQ